MEKEWDGKDGKRRRFVTEGDGIKNGRKMGGARSNSRRESA